MVRVMVTNYRITKTYGQYTRTYTQIATFSVDVESVGVEYRRNMYIKGDVLRVS